MKTEATVHSEHWQYYDSRNFEGVAISACRERVTRSKNVCARSFHEDPKKVCEICSGTHRHAREFESHFTDNQKKSQRAVDSDDGHLCLRFGDMTIPVTSNDVGQALAQISGVVIVDKFEIILEQSPRSFLELCYASDDRLIVCRKVSRNSL